MLNRTCDAAALTPERVAAMSDAELSEAVAVNALRYSNAAVSPTPAPYFWHAPNGAVRVWSPGLNLSANDAFAPDSPKAYNAVLEHMRQRWTGCGIRWEIGDEDNPVLVLDVESGELTEEDPGPRWCATARAADGTQHAAAESESLGRAVFECALLSAVALQEGGGDG